MLIEAARGGHTGVVGMLLRQPKFTETLRSQMLAQKQATISAIGECIVGTKRKNRPHSGGRAKKQQKSPSKIGSLASPVEAVSTSSVAPNKGDNQGGNFEGQKQFQFKTSDYSMYQKQQQLYMKQQQLMQHNFAPSASPSYIFNYQQDIPPPCSLSLVNPTNPYASSIAEKIKASVKWTGEGVCEHKGDPNESTMNPSYKFAPHSLIYPVYSSQVVPPQSCVSISSRGDEIGQ